MSDAQETEHLFDQAVALRAHGENRWLGRTSPAYANFIGPYGGITAAQALNAVLLHPQRLGDPVAFTINYAAAVSDGEFEIHAKPARTNRSTQHWTIEILQEGVVILTATAMTAVRRDTWAPASDGKPDAPAPADVPLPPGRGRVEWINRYELRQIAGHFPSKWDERDTGSTLTQQWMRDSPPRPLDYASLASLCDCFFPRIWLHRAKFVPIGTVSMTIYFHADAAALAAAGDGYLLGQARAQGFHNGYFDQTAQLWSEAGRLLATTHQVVYYRE